VPRFLQQAITGGSVVLFGKGEQSRDFIYVTDVVEALIRAATAKKVNRQVINIGSGMETTIAELVAAMEKVTGKSVNQLNNREKTGGVPRLVADISRAQDLLDFQPTIGLSDGLKRMVVEDTRFH
jgi:UDP-glucose 4-epimerase